MKRLVLVLVLVLLLAACQDSPETTETESSEAAESFSFNIIEEPPHDKFRLALSMLNHLQEGEYEKAYAMFDEVLKGSISLVDLSGLWTQIQANQGHIKEIFSYDEKEQEAFTSLYFGTSFEQDNATLEVSVNDEDEIVGFYLYPYGDEEETSEPVYDGEELSFGEEFPLKGTLKTPEEGDKFPVVVFVHGSGPLDRNSSIGPNAMFEDMAEALAEQGIASFRYDKRTYTYNKDDRLREEDFLVHDETVEDAALAVEMLKTHPAVDPEQIYVAGHSLGAMMIPRISKETSSIKGVVFMAAPSKNVVETMHDQVMYLLENYETGHEGHDHEHDIVHLEDLKMRIEDALDPDTPLENRSREILGVSESYWNDILAYDQVEEAKEIKLPMLFLQGERDYQVTMKDFEKWQEELSAKKHVTFKSYPSLNHLLIAGEGAPSPEEYMVEGTVDPQVSEDIGSWIRGNND